ncbi:MAG: hypothetical protein H7Z16_03350 [Pyrinomonadaceae bacterium]|nr:hypothetical protein [Pyrinomonadaceae bacterium]
MKKEILAELTPKSFKSDILEITRHPIILLIIGSIFGGWLSSCYQSREWNRQQQELTQKQKVEKKLAARDETIDAIIEAHAAAEAAVRPLIYENMVTFVTNDKDRVKERSEASKKWQKERLRLSQNLALYFTDPAIRAKFSEIIDLKNPKGNLLFVEVNNIVAAAKENPELLDESAKPFGKQSAKYRAFKEAIRDNVFALTPIAMKKTIELRELMQKEIQKDGPAPHWLIPRGLRWLLNEPGGNGQATPSK